MTQCWWSVGWSIGPVLVGETGKKHPLHAIHVIVRRNTSKIDGFYLK